MKTIHKIIFENSTEMKALPSESVDIMVTSPPYPMVEMWDEMFCRQSASVKKALEEKDGPRAFELIHRLMDPIWEEVYRVLKVGSIACINIGDATRTVNDNFVLYPNHVRILQFASGLGFSTLPCILWRKQTNAPNKFMGSGMLPAGAYVTLEHEYILILRKGSKRKFKDEEDKKNRRESAFFWEERNRWFSDVWFDVKGMPQALNNQDTRSRSAAYPFEVPYRLINMYSVKGDTVLDPFWGTGTTTAAAIAAGRNSIGYELDRTLDNGIDHIRDVIIDSSRHLIRQRLAKHLEFVVQQRRTKQSVKHNNLYYGFPVKTAQEKELLLNDPLKIKRAGEGIFEVQYSDKPQPEFCKDWTVELQRDNLDVVSQNLRRFISAKNSLQMPLF